MNEINSTTEGDFSVGPIHRRDNKAYDRYDYDLEKQVTLLKVNKT